MHGRAQRIRQGNPRSTEPAPAPSADDYAWIDTLRRWTLPVSIVFVFALTMAFAAGFFIAR